MDNINRAKIYWEKLIEIGDSILPIKLRAGHNFVPVGSELYYSSFIDPITHYNVLTYYCKDCHLLIQTPAIGGRNDTETELTVFPVKISALIYAEFYPWKEFRYRHIKVQGSSIISALKSTELKNQEEIRIAQNFRSEGLKLSQLFQEKKYISCSEYGEYFELLMKSVLRYGAYGTHNWEPYVREEHSEVKLKFRCKVCNYRIRESTYSSTHKLHGSFWYGIFMDPVHGFHIQDCDDVLMDRALK